MKQTEHNSILKLPPSQQCLNCLQFVEWKSITVSFQGISTQDVEGHDNNYSRESKTLWARMHVGSPDSIRESIIGPKQPVRILRIPSFKNWRKEEAKKLSVVDKKGNIKYRLVPRHQIDGLVYKKLHELWG